MKFPLILNSASKYFKGDRTKAIRTAITARELQKKFLPTVAVTDLTNSITNLDQPFIPDRPDITLQRVLMSFRIPGHPNRPLFLSVGKDNRYKGPDSRILVAYQRYFLRGKGKDTEQVEVATTVLDSLSAIGMACSNKMGPVVWSCFTPEYRQSQEATFSFRNQDHRFITTHEQGVELLQQHKAFSQ